MGKAYGGYICKGAGGDVDTRKVLECNHKEIGPNQYKLTLYLLYHNYGTEEYMVSISFTDRKCMLHIKVFSAGIGHSNYPLKSFLICFLSRLNHSYWE